MAIIGIDLGTTNSLGAVYKDGQVHLIPNRYGSFLTPSVVSLEDDGHIVVGEIAKARLVTAPTKTVASFKKDMGTDKRYTLGHKQFTPEELSSFIIASIVDDAKSYLNEDIDEVIISVPAYFHDRQRVATKRAGALANIRVNRLINEPSAAALASYYHTHQEQLFLIFDFGGGTLDVSIVDCFDTMVEIISVSGDNRLGGDTFHEIMVTSFLKEHNLQKDIITDKDYAILLHQAEVCKRHLSHQTMATMSASIHNQIYTSEYTNERLLNESGIVLSKIKKVLTHALNDVHLSIQDIHGIVMVGGSSKMPMIQKYLQHLFGQTPIISNQCDEYIVRGLGMVCAIKAREVDVKDFILTDICPFSLGTEVLNSNDAQHNLMSTIIGRNSVLPCSKVERYYSSYDNQMKIDISILQGEHMYAEDNLCLGQMSVPIPRAKAGKEAIDVRFTYDLNGILIVDVTVVSTQKTITQIVSSCWNEEEILLKAKQLEALKVHPQDVSENKMVMERLLALYEEMPPYERESIASCIHRFEYYLKQQNNRQIRQYRQYLLSVIEQLENYDPFAKEWDFDDYEEESDEDGDDDWIN